jgi:hypothetical protein
MYSYPHRIAKFPDPYPGDLEMEVQTSLAAAALSMDKGASREHAEATLVKGLEEQDYSKDFVAAALAFFRKQL